jgi:hypothetical protein
VGIRGTFSVHDVLVDMTGRNEEYLGGLVHSGILKAATKKKELFVPYLKEALQVTFGSGLNNWVEFPRIWNCDNGA